jgi:Big-like domain-containing protein/invasin-like protein/calcineurin-like phosphoesterase family protein
MTRRVFPFNYLKVLAVTGVIAVVTCTVDREPLAPGRLEVPRFALQSFQGPQVFVGAGDIATCANDNDAATATLIDGIAGTVFTAGDDAYPNGRAVDYQNCYDPTWGRFKARTWAVLGNHEYDSSATAQPSFDYFGDRAGPAGLGYHSIDLGAWHIIFLNDNGQFVPFKSGSVQDQWLVADLAAHPNLCTLVIWHQPAFYSNKNPTGATSDPARKIFWDRLYAAGVDVVLNGHQHQYERFQPMTPDGTVDLDHGIREFIVATGGESTGQPQNIAPNSVVHVSTYGVTKFTLKDGGYDWQYIPIPGQTFTDAGSASCHDAPGGVSGDQSTVVAAPTTVLKSLASTITVTAKDGNGNPVAGAFVTLAATGTGNTLTQPASYTDANGVATGTLSSTVTETKTISATVNGLALAQTASVVVTATASARKSKVATSQGYIAMGSGTSTITVTVNDATGHAVGGATVTLQATGSGNTLTQPTALTDANGIATGTLNSTVAETKTVSAIANGTLISQTVNVVVTTPSSAKSTLAANPTSFTAGVGSSVITATVRDAGNHALAGAAVALSATGSGNVLTQPVALTDANGVATGSLTSAVAGARVVSATANGTAITKTVNVTVNPSPVSPTLSTVAAAPASIPVGSGTATITVTVKNGSGQPIGNATVVLAASGSGNTLTQPVAKTNASGVTTGTLSSSVAEVKTISATANGIALNQTASVTVTAGGVSASLSTLDATPGSISADGGGTTITVTAKDGSGNPISGATVVLGATGTSNTLTQPAGVTDANGVATGTLSSTVAEAKTVSATVGGIALTQTAVVTVTPGTVSADQSTVVASPGTIQAGNGTSAVTVTAKDAHGNPISSATVVLAATGTGNTLVQPTGTTNASGVATGSLGSSVAEAKTVSATINGTAVTQTASVSVTPASVSGTQSSVGVDQASITAGSGLATITVTVRNSNGDPVSGANVVLASTGTQNILVQPSGPTDANGVATGTLSSNKAELKTISAMADGVAITQTAAVTVTAGAVSGAASAVTAAPTSIAPGSETSTIRVTAKDGFGNPVSGATIVLAATGSGNTLTQPTTTTNTIGVASGTLSSTVSEDKTVSATANGVAITQTATVTVTAPSQGAITHTLLTSGNDVNNVKIYTTASIAPAPNALVTVVVTTHNATAAAAVPTLSGGGMASWDVVATTTYDVVGTPKKRITIFRAMNASPGSGPITITSSATLSNCQWIVSQWSGVDGSGTNGSGAIVQTASNAADAVTTLATPLAAFASPNDVAYGVFGVNSNVVAITPGAGFTEIDEQPSTESTAADLFAEWAVNLPTINASWASKNAGALGVEIKASP